MGKVWLHYGKFNDIVESKNILVVNDQEKRMSTRHTTYDSIPKLNHTYYLPSSYASSIGSTTLETRSRYSYDDSLNVSSIEVDGIETVYIWSYKGQYPVAKIEGLTYAKVKTALGSDISTLLGKAIPSTADISTLRSRIKTMGGHITTFTYKPLVGITSETLPNGQTVRYEYDGLGT